MASSQSMGMTLSMTHRIVAASTLKGIRVQNFAGEELAKVDDLVVDLDSGQVTYLVLSLGGFLGIGDRLFAVPWDLFSTRAGEHELFLDIEKQMLLDAPAFERIHWPDMSDETWADKIRAHYQQQPYWNSSTS